MLNTDFDAPSFLSLAEEYLRRRRTEGAYSIELFANEFPHLREKIIDEFPGLLIAESLKPTKPNNALPETLGRYEVGKEIGRGAMGIVVSGANPDLESEVAIKLLPFDRIRSIEILQRFRAEAKICAALEHPNIVPVFDYGTDKNFAFLVMRKVTGNSLDQVIAALARTTSIDDSVGTQLDWDFVTSIGIQAAEALHYAHEQGVIHRDIKPANLILEEEGRLWITDFGLSKVLSSDIHLSMTGDVVGTPRYMAPEQLRGVYNACSDVYSLGITLYELASAQLAWDPEMELTQLLARKQTLEFPHLKTRNPAVPDALCEVIMQAVELRPEDRFANAKELSIALKQATNGTFIGDRRIKDRASSRRSLVRNIAFASCMSLIASAGVYMFAPNVSKDLASLLRQPDKVQEIFAHEDSRQIIAEQIPGLIQTALESEDKEVRALFADVVTTLLEPSHWEEDGTEVQSTGDSKALTRLLDEYVESGMHGANSHETLQLSKEDLLAEARLSAEQIERLRNEINASSMSAEWKKHAQKQISRNQFAADNGLISNNRKRRIKTFFVSLLCENVDLNLPLSAENLQFFISFLEKELDLADVPVVDAQKKSSGPDLVDNTQSTLPNSSEQDAQIFQDSVRQIVKDPRLSELVDEATDDPRFQKLLDRAASDPRLRDLLDKARKK